MEPRGKVKKLIDAMKAQPEKRFWRRSDVLEYLQLPNSASPSSHLAPACAQGWIYKHDLGSRRVAYSLHPPEQAPAPPFSASLWGDGDMVLNGVEIRDDGAVQLSAEQVGVIKRLLTGAIVS